jgi:xanthine dehydrogenase accessory factor
MKNIYEEIEQLLAGGETVATATVVRTQGSTPREVGAKMVVRPSGDIVGTIGGGCGEAAVRQVAMSAIGDGERQTMRLDLTDDVTLDTEMVCGGVMSVFIDLWDERDLEFLEAVNKGFEESKKLALATPISTAQARPRRLILPDGQTVGTLGDEEVDAWVTSQALEALTQGATRTVTDPRKLLEIFIEVQISPPTLIIAGAGHIAVPLARLGTMMGFRVVVLDDRPAFANRERFPEADEVLAADFGETLSTYPLDDQIYIAIMTRGHSHDMECLLQVIESPVPYIGMIGSRRRVRGVFDLVKAEGYSEEALARVHAPIGLDIGAQTPEEIALSVMAEVVKARRGGTGSSLWGTDAKA